MNKEKDIVRFTKEQKPHYIFNGCICYINDGYLSFASIDDPQLPNRETVFGNLFEYCINNQQIINSVEAGLVEVRREKDKKVFQDELAKRYGRNALKFHDEKTRQIILDFISKVKLT
ncbi:MAG: hypothetical protein NY202_01835 [Mollicutes bacterium UO1]